VTGSVISAGGSPLASVTHGDGPVVAFALHAGHELRPGLEEHIAISAQDRLREEDPATADMAPRGVTCVDVLRSRFEVDLNRPRFRAVYQGPADSWGLCVYRHDLPDDVDRVSRAVYDTFYATAFDVLSRVAEEHGHFVVLDIHSYNHRRDGIDRAPADPAGNPEVNVGTRWLDRERWADVVEGFSAVMEGQGFDCRENVKFGGGHFARWVSETFPDTGVTLAIEFKKTYMDECSGEVDPSAVDRIREALTACLPVLETALARRV